MLSDCCKSETFLQTSIWVKKEEEKIPFRNNWHCKECGKICLFAKEKKNDKG